MVLDTLTVSRLYDLASVVRDYVSPDAVSRELTEQQKADGCLMRFEHGWHAHHIIEALGIAPSVSSWRWGNGMMEALEECAQSDYWNTQGIRLDPNIAPGGQISLEGTNQYGSKRQSALKNAIAGVLTRNPKARIAATQDENKRDIPGTSLMERAFAVIDEEIRQGRYRNTRPRPLTDAFLRDAIADLVTEGFKWEGAVRRTGIVTLPEDIRKAVDDEILRQCREQVEKGEINYSAIAENVYENFIINEQQDTMAKAIIDDESGEFVNYGPISASYVLELCKKAGITADIVLVTPIAEQVANQANIKRVQDVKKAHPRWSVMQVRQETGLSRGVVAGIFDNLGFPHSGRTYTHTAIRKIIFAAHDNEKLTIQEILDKHPEVAEHYKGGSYSPFNSVLRVLRDSLRIPITEESREAEASDARRIPLRASQLKSAFLHHLRSQDEAWLERVRGNISRTRRTADYNELTGYSVQRLAEDLNETEDFIRSAIGLVAEEPPHIITIAEPDRRGTEAILIPYSGLLWITMGGEAVDGEVG
jgi:hypothetical protein